MKFLDSRKIASEGAYTHRHSLDYQTKIHRTKLFGLMLADDLALDDGEAEAYATDLVDYYSLTLEDDDLVDRVICDLYEIGVIEHRWVIEKKLRDAEAIADEDLYGV